MQNCYLLLKSITFQHQANILSRNPLKHDYFEEKYYFFQIPAIIFTENNLSFPQSTSKLISLLGRSPLLVRSH